MEHLMPARVIRLGALAALLAGCITGSNRDRSFAEGHYLLGTRFDQSYAYEQYFVVLPDRRFEWVEYGYNAATLKVCKVTRKAGAYALEDSSVAVSVSAEAAPFVKCGMSKAEFQALALADKEKASPAQSAIRNRNETGFEAEGFFSTTPGWKSIPLKPDPYGFY